MVFQYTGALPSSNIVHEGRVNLKGRNSQIHHNHDSTSKNIRQWFFFFPHLCPCFVFLASVYIHFFCKPGWSCVHPGLHAEPPMFYTSDFHDKSLVLKWKMTRKRNSYSLVSSTGLVVTAAAALTSPLILTTLFFIGKNRGNELPMKLLAG